MLRIAFNNISLVPKIQNSLFERRIIIYIRFKSSFLFLKIKLLACEFHHKGQMLQLNVTSFYTGSCHFRPCYSFLIRRNNLLTKESEKASDGEHPVTSEPPCIGKKFFTFRATHRRVLRQEEVFLQWQSPDRMHE